MLSGAAGLLAVATFFERQQGVSCRLAERMRSHTSDPQVIYEELAEHCSIQEHSLCYGLSKTFFHKKPDKNSHLECPFTLLRLAWIGSSKALKQVFF